MAPVNSPSSFRDPSGRVFLHEGLVFRSIDHSYQTEYDLLMGSGLHADLVDLGLLISHEESEVDDSFSTIPYKVIKPEQIPFISYPYEWSFSQLKDAALATLEIQKQALAYGMTLKDASAFNIQFLRGRPVLIDTLSFDVYQEGDPWSAYKQFCQHFLAPLALMAYRHVGLNKLSQVHIDGIPLDLASSLLPLRTRIKPSLAIHLHLHSHLQNKHSSTDSKKSRDKSQGNGKFKRGAFLGLLDSLESAIKGLKLRSRTTEWSDYYDGDSYTEAGMANKLEIVGEFIKEAAPNSVWDLGGNTGRFSRLASDMGIQTVSFDLDPIAVEKNYNTVVAENESSILPLISDLSNPTPSIGWSNNERMSLGDRGPTDMVMALALIHHLAIGNNVPLEMIAEFLNGLCTWAVVEFVPKSDKQTMRLLESRNDTFPDYNSENFELAFSRHFDIRSKVRVVDSERDLYLLKAR